MKLDYSDINFKNNGKLKLLIIVGTRPEIIRLAAVINAVNILIVFLLIQVKITIIILMGFSSKI